MKLKEAKELFKKDFYRHYGYYPKNVWLKGLFGTENIRYCFMFRLYQSLMNKHALLKPVVAMIRIRQAKKSKVNIPKSTIVGPGLCIFHLRNIIIDPHSKIGSNFTIGHQATIGRVNSGRFKGSPEIGDNVYVGPGALLIGSIKIGDNVLIAGNAFVNKDIPSNSAVFGNPCVIMPNKNATEGYIINRV